MRRERQGHLGIAYIDVRMVIGLLCPFCDTVDEIDALQETIELKSLANGERAFRPARYGLELKTDLFGG